MAPINQVSAPLKTRVIGNLRGADRTPLVLIHGWGGDSTLWSYFLKSLGESHPVVLIELPGFGLNADRHVENLDDLYHQIESVLPGRCHILGWSLGGMIATKLCERSPERFSSLVTIACNAKFVVSPNWLAACERNIYLTFQASFEDDPQKTINRFLQLQAQGDDNRKHLVNLFRKHLVFDSELQRDTWAQALTWLDDIDNRESLAALQVPHCAIFGEQDNLVPALIGDVFSKNKYAMSALVVSGAGHAPHLSKPEQVAKHVNHFLAEIICNGRDKKKPYSIDKNAIAQSFSSAARHYEGAANLQRKVANRLISFKSSYQGTICDLGCGTGFCLDTIKKHPCDVVGIDLAHGMLKTCLEKLHSPLVGLENDSLICGDFDYLPLADNTLDGICSSMSIQWSENIQQLLKEVRRVLKPNGWFLFSTLGPKTLHELRSSWECVDGFVHVNRFDENAIIDDALKCAGFSVLKNLTEIELLKYDSVYALMRDLKAIGAHNLNAGKRKGLTTKTQLRQLEAAYEKYRIDGKVPATYEVYYFLVRADL